MEMCNALAFLLKHKMAIKKCSKCQHPFECTNDKLGCWCEGLFIELDVLNSLQKEYNNCLCINCLSQFADNKQLT
jgi:hypothetical protein